MATPRATNGVFVATHRRMRAALWQYAPRRHADQRPLARATGQLVRYFNGLRARCLLTVATGMLGLAAACGGTHPRTGSETNFLKSCDAGCGDGLSCICGVCTRACSSDAECTSLASAAECVAETASGSGESCSGNPAAICDLACRENADCAALGNSFACQDDHCRVPAPEFTTNECAATTLAVGDNDLSVLVGGATRNAVVRIPESFDGTTPVPLLLDFHTLLGTPAGEAINSGYRELAEREGFIVVYPEGIEGAWNIGPCCTSSRDVDDVGFARALVGRVQSEACIDSKRVYAAGVAMGGGMAYQLGCNAADVFAGIAPSSFDLLAEEDQPCLPSAPVTVISFRGTADSLVPYEGGAVPAPNLPDVTMNFLGAVGTFEKWAELDRCSGSPSEPDAEGCSTYSDCAGGVEVTLCTAEGGATAWGSAERGWQALSRISKP